MMKDEYPIASQVILNNTYVDDIVDSVDDTSSAEKNTDQIERVIERGGFQIKHWTYSVKNEGADIPRELPDCCDPVLQGTTEPATQPIRHNNDEQKS